MRSSAGWPGIPDSTPSSPRPRRLDQRGGGPVCHADEAPPQTRCLPLRHRAERGHRGLPQGPQRRPEAPPPRCPAQLRADIRGWMPIWHSNYFGTVIAVLFGGVVLPVLAVLSVVAVLPV